MTMKEVKAIAQDHVRLKDNLVKIRKLIGKELLIEATGMSASTWVNRMKNPGKFTYDELKAISRVSGIAFVELTTDVISLKGDKK